MKSKRKEVHKSRKRRGREIEMSLSSPRESQRREKNESYKSGKALDRLLDNRAHSSLSLSINTRKEKRREAYLLLQTQ